MFLGSPDEIGTIVGSYQKSGKTSLRIAVSQQFAGGLTSGSGIAVDGAAATIEDVAAKEISVSVSDATLWKSTLGRVSAGAIVGLEPAIKVGADAPQHSITGEVDSQVAVSSFERNPTGLRLGLGLPQPYGSKLKETDQITINGLTVQILRKNQDSFEIEIPLSSNLGSAVFSQKIVGTFVNVEFDNTTKAAAKIVEQVARESILSEWETAPARFALLWLITLPFSILVFNYAGADDVVPKSLVIAAATTLAAAFYTRIKFISTSLSESKKLEVHTLESPD